MKAGRLRHRVAVLSYTESQDAYGGLIRSESTTATIWAAVEPLRGQKVFEAQQISAKADTKIVCRYTDAVKINNTLSHGGKRYRVLSIINILQKNVELNILCETLGRNDTIPVEEEEG